MKKVFTAASIVAITLLTSCGGSTEGEKVGSTEEAPTEVYEETLKAQDEIDDIKVEMEEMEEVEAELEDLESELDNI